MRLVRIVDETGMERWINPDKVESVEPQGGGSLLWLGSRTIYMREPPAVVAKMLERPQANEQEERRCPKQSNTR